MVRLEGGKERRKGILRFIILEKEIKVRLNS